MQQPDFTVLRWWLEIFHFLNWYIDEVDFICSTNGHDGDKSMFRKNVGKFLNAVTELDFVNLEK